MAEGQIAKLGLSREEEEQIAQAITQLQDHNPTLAILGNRGYVVFSSIRRVRILCQHLSTVVCPRLEAMLAAQAGDAANHRNQRQLLGLPIIGQNFNTLLTSVSGLPGNLNEHLTVGDMTGTLLECYGVELHLTLRSATPGSREMLSFTEGNKNFKATKVVNIKPKRFTQAQDVQVYRWNHLAEHFGVRSPIVALLRRIENEKLTHLSNGAMAELFKRLRDNLFEIVRELANFIPAAELRRAAPDIFQNYDFKF